MNKPFTQCTKMKNFMQQVRKCFLFLGNSLGILWKFFGNSLEIFWKFFGNSLEILWKFFGNSLESLCNAFGIFGNSIGFFSNHMNRIFEYLLNTYGSNLCFCQDFGLRKGRKQEENLNP